MSESVADYRKYLDPRTLARIGSLDLRARLIVEGLMTGMHRSPYQGISVEFAQHRPYVAGDDIRHVDWKVFGRSDKIYLKQVPRWNKTNTGKILDQIAEKLTHRSLIVILSDFFDDLESIRQGLRHLRYKKHEIMAFQLLDPAEIEFPFEDVTLFKGLEEAGELLTDPRALREGYIAELARFTDELRKLCRGMHIDFVRMNSGE